MLIFLENVSISILYSNLFNCIYYIFLLLLNHLSKAHKSAEYIAIEN